MLLLTGKLRRALGALAIGVVVALGHGPAGGEARAQEDARSPAATRAPVAAEGQAGTPASVEELEALSRTLRDDAQRERFLATLDRLIAVRRAQAEPAQGQGTGLTDRIVHRVSGHIETLSDRFAKVLSVIRDAPRLLPWAEDRLYDGAARADLIEFIWRFIVVVGLGMLAQYVFRRLTGAYRRRLERDPAGESILARIVRFSVRAVMLYASALSYAAGAYGSFAVLRMEGTAGDVMLVGAASFFVAKLVLATTRIVVAPGVVGLRPVPVSDETAQYLYIWARRLVRIFVYAFFLLEAASLVGLPEAAHDSLMYLLGLALAGFLVVFVMQSRQPVAGAIRGGEEGAVTGGLRARFASSWHLFAILYIAAVYLVWMFRVEGGFALLTMATLWTAVIIVVAKLVILGAGRGIDHVFRIGPGVAARYPGLEARANRYLPVFKGVIRWVAYVVALFIALDVWGVNTLGWLASPQGAALLQRAVTIALILIVALVAWEAVNLMIGRYLDRLAAGGTGTARARTLLPLLRTTALIVIAVLVTLVVLSELGVNIAPLLAGAGVVGLAIGFGSQKLVQDVITGLFILIEDTLAVGDVVEFDASHAGIVEAISVRTVRLRDLSGSVHTLPFSEVKTILNMTKGFGFYLMEVGVAYRENVDHVMQVLHEIGEEMRADPEYGALITEPLEILGLDKFGDSAVVIKARLRVVPPIKKWFVGREFNRRMKARFDAEGIEIPFPHQTLYFGEDKSGMAPPARVVVTGAAAPSAAAGGEPPPSIPKSTAPGD